MKKWIFLILAALCAALVLSACGAEPGAEADLVFVNGSDAVVVEVVVDFQDQAGGCRNADSSPLKKGETFGFEAGEYPVTVYVYDAPFDGFAQQELALLTIQEAPPEGKRWYVTAWDGAKGMTLSADTGWPAELNGQGR